MDGLIFAVIAWVTRPERRWQSKVAAIDRSGVRPTARCPGFFVPPVAEESTWFLS
jgi:hypothetical protein